MSASCRYGYESFSSAKRKCEKQGARLPNSAELISLINSGQISGNFLASEEYEFGDYNTYIVRTSNGKAGNASKSGTSVANSSIICIGR